MFYGPVNAESLAYVSEGDVNFRVSAALANSPSSGADELVD